MTLHTGVRFDADQAREWHEHITAELIARLERAIPSLGRLAVNARPENRQRLLDKQGGVKAALELAKQEQRGWTGIFWRLTEAATSVAPEHREGWALAISYAAEGFRLH